MKPVPGDLLVFDSPARYRIVVGGVIGGEYGDRLAGMSVRRTRARRGGAHTCLTGMVMDQAALIGVLNTIYELHLPILSVIRIDLRKAAGASPRRV